MFDPSLQTIWGGGNLTAVFCDTGWEHPDTYKHDTVSVWNNFKF